VSNSLPPKDAPTIHRVTIAGRVIDPDTDQPISSALVELTSVPNGFRQRLALKGLQYGDRWQEMCNRPDRSLTAIDGFFYFVDLPDGKYQLAAFLPKFGNRYDYQLMSDRDRRCYSTQPITVIVPTDKTINDIALSLAATVKANESIASQKPVDSQVPGNLNDFKATQEAASSEKLAEFSASKPPAKRAKSKASQKSNDSQKSSQ
jgi:hypothetical protein